MYKLIAVFSIFVRTFYLDGPMGEVAASLVQDQSYVVVVSLLLNAFIETPMYIFTYAIVGMFYERSNMPSFGSFLYLCFYVLHTFLLQTVLSFSLNAYFIVISIIGYVTILNIIKQIFSNIQYRI